MLLNTVPKSFLAGGAEETVAVPRRSICRRHCCGRGEPSSRSSLRWLREYFRRITGTTLELPIACDRKTQLVLCQIGFLLT